MMVPGHDLNKIVDGKTLSDHWKFYTYNVKYLEVLTHEEFCREFPNAAEEIRKANETLGRLEALLGVQS